MKPVVFLAGAALALAQTQIKPIVSQRTVNEQVNVVRLAPRYATAIRLPEAVSSVVVGDPVKFLAEHSDKEPTLVLVKPVSEDIAESNLLVTTVNGWHLSFLLRSDGPSSRPPVDFVVNYRPAGSFLVEESGVGTTEVSGTEELVPMRPVAAVGAARDEELRESRACAALPQADDRDAPAAQIAPRDRRVEDHGHVSSPNGDPCPPRPRNPSCVPYAPSTPRARYDHTSAPPERVHSPLISMLYRSIVDLLLPP